MFFRNEKTIAGVEKKNSVRVRWKESDATFQNAHERLTSKRRSNEMLALHKLASERVFLLELKAKYAGLHTFIFIEILRNSSGATKVCTGSCIFFLEDYKEGFYHFTLFVVIIEYSAIEILRYADILARLSSSFVMQAGLQTRCLTSQAV